MRVNYYYIHQNTILSSSESESALTLRSLGLKFVNQSVIPLCIPKVLKLFNSHFLYKRCPRFRVLEGKRIESEKLSFSQLGFRVFPFERSELV
jgi:hypothetical protein